MGVLQTVQLKGWGVVGEEFYQISVLVLHNIDKLIHIEMGYEYRLPGKLEWLKLDEPIGNHNPLNSVNNTSNRVKASRQELENSHPITIPPFHNQNPDFNIPDLTNGLLLICGKAAEFHATKIGEQELPGFVGNYLVMGVLLSGLF